MRSHGGAWAGIAAVALMGCDVQAPDAADFTGAGFAVDGGGQIQIDGQTVPIAACIPGQVVARAADDWSCLDEPSSMVDWSAVQNVPAGFADGDDADLLATLGCGNGEGPFWSGGSWTCAAFQPISLTDLYGSNCSAIDTASQRYNGALQVCDGSDWVSIQPELTPQETLALVTGADGSGSTLDADTLHGLEPTGLVFESGSETIDGSVVIHDVPADQSLALTSEGISADGIIEINTPLSGNRHQGVEFSGRRLHVYRNSNEGDSHCNFRCSSVGGVCLLAFDNSPFGTWRKIACGTSVVGDAIRCLCLSW